MTEKSRLRRYVVRRSAAAEGCFDADRFEADCFETLRFRAGFDVLGVAAGVEVRVGFLLALRADVGVAMRVGYPDDSGGKLGADESLEDLIQRADDGVGFYTRRITA